MKKLVTTFLLATVWASAEIPVTSNITAKSEELFATVPVATKPIKKGTIYVKAITDSQVSESQNVFPGMGFGYRRAFGHSGVDISLNYTRGKGWVGKERSATWTFPKVSYLYYVNPMVPSSFYAGTGLSWGVSEFERKVTNGEEQGWEFTGLIPHFTLGYELFRTSSATTFVELNASRPLIPSSFYGDRRPGTLVELSVGAGF